MPEENVIMFLDTATLVTWLAILLLTISTFVLGAGWKNNATNISILAERILILEKAVNPVTPLPEIPTR